MLVSLLKLVFSRITLLLCGLLLVGIIFGGIRAVF